MPNNPDKQALIDQAEAARAKREVAEQDVAILRERLDAAYQRQFETTQAQEAAYAAAFADEIAAAAATAKANEERHEREHAGHRAKIASRKATSGVGSIDHTALKVMTIDDKTHEIVAAHGLKLGHKGFGAKERDASRYVAACGLSVDAVHEELHHERFDQKAKPNCPGCGSALAMMKSGELEDRRADYLTSDEQLAHARAKNAARNAAVSGKSS